MQLSNVKYKSRLSTIEREREREREREDRVYTTILTKKNLSKALPKKL